MASMKSCATNAPQNAGGGSRNSKGIEGNQGTTKHMARTYLSFGPLPIWLEINDFLRSHQSREPRHITRHIGFGY